MGVGQRREVQGCWGRWSASGVWAACCCVERRAGRELDAGVELRRARCELCGAEERAEQRGCQRDCCGKGRWAERAQLWGAAGSAGVWVAWGTRVRRHGGRERLRGVCVGVGQRREVQGCWGRWSASGVWAACCCVERRAVWMCFRFFHI